MLNNLHVTAPTKKIIRTVLQFIIKLGLILVMFSLAISVSPVCAQDAPPHRIFLPAITGTASTVISNSILFDSCASSKSFQAGDYLVLNNQWNKRLMGVNDIYKQCVQVNNSATPVATGWNWSWPKLQSQVKAYPEIIYGWAPWLPASSNSNLPVQLSKMGNFVANFDTTTTSPDGTYNTAFDLWITNTAKPTPASRTHEIMIWVADQNPWVSIKSTAYIGRLSIDGQEYDLWKNPLSNWTLLIFRKVNSMPSGSIAIDHFLKYLMSEGHIPSTSYLADIEFGNEIVAGTGKTTIRNFSITQP